MLFTKAALLPKPTAYPAIGQKKLNGAASRVIVFFAAELSHQIYEDFPTDLHRFADCMYSFPVKY